MLPFVVVVRQRLAVDGFASSSTPVSGISSVPNEVWGHAVDDGSLVVERYAGLPYAFLACAESAEVLRRLRVRVGEELYHVPTNGSEVDGDFEEDSRVCRHRGLITHLGFATMRRVIFFCIFFFDEGVTYHKVLS